MPAFGCIARVALIGFLACAGAGSGAAQGIYGKLQELQQKSNEPPPRTVSLEEQCRQRITDDRSTKCQGFYVERGFKTKWLGIVPLSHPPIVEVMEFGEIGVFCVHSSVIDARTPCYNLMRPQAFAALGSGRY